MPFHKTFGIDLGTSTVKIYSQEQDTMITEKNMIAIRNQNQVLAVGNEAYGMYEKNPSNVSVISPMAFGKIADVTHTEMVLPTRESSWQEEPPEYRIWTGLSARQPGRESGCPVIMNCVPFVV